MRPQPVTIVTKEPPHYPEKEILKALEGKYKQLSGMFHNHVGESLDLRSGAANRWQEFMPACEGHTKYIRPRAATNLQGSLVITDF